MEAITMTMLTSAMKVFKAVPNSAKWIPKQSFKNCTVSFEKRFLKGNNGQEVFTGIDKVVTRKDGTVIRGQFAPEGYLMGTRYETNRGFIETNFGAQNYDRVTTIRTKLGDNLTRLGHNGKPERYIDFYGNNVKRYDCINDDGATYKKLVDYIKPPKNTPLWFQQMMAKW